jgi:molybdopterin molybdotransferase
MTIQTQRKEKSGISPEEALYLVLSHTGFSQTTIIPLADAAGCTLAGDVLSPVQSPPFNQAAMDGYAFRYDGIDPDGPVPVIGLVQAGASEPLSVVPGTATRIFTGAPVPENADTVVMQEWVEEKSEEILFVNKNIIKGSNIRLAGSQTEKGAVAVKKGTRLSPGAIGYLCSLGICEAEVYSAPAIGIITSGDELVFPGEELSYGKIFESNSAMLRAALYEGRLAPVFVKHVSDNETEITETLKNALHQCQIVLIAGGISVGTFDYTKNALNNNSVEEIFYKVKQKPGKPLFFGKAGHKLVFGLPGNPAAALTCFYKYVVPCIRKIGGMEPLPPNELYAALENTASNKSGLTLFLKGRLSGGRVKVLQGQESYRLDTFADSNCLVELSADKTGYLPGEKVKVYDLNRMWL